MKQRVLITGASGFIGRSCLEPFVRRGYEVIALGGSRIGDDEPGITWRQADLLDREQFNDLVAEAQADTLLHLAWIVKPGASYTSPENFRWVSSSMDLVEQFVHQGGRRVVVAGTCYEYDQRYGWCHEHRTPTNPVSIYGVCKNALRQMLSAYCQSVDVSFAWPRIFFVYGPHEHPNRLVPSVIRSLLHGEPAKCSHGRQLRDFLYVQDLADALVALCDSNIQNEINIASGEPVTLAQIVTRIGDLMRRPDLIELGALPARAMEPPFVAADIARAHELLRWSPKHELNASLEDTIAWWQAQLQVATGEHNA